MTQLPGHEQLERFRHIVARRLGLHFDDAKLAFLGEVLRRRLEATGERPGGYLSRLDLKISDEELSALASELTVGETYFFRNIDQFHALSQVVLPHRIRTRSAQRCLQLVSAGCASGEEAFSLAISIGEAVPDPSWKVFIRAVDVSRTALEKAARGRFTAWSLRETPPEIQRRYFRREGREVVLNEATRAAVTFELRNLIVDDPQLWPPGTYDVVFCRNVLMYFTPEQAQGVVTRITRALAPDGYLFLGHAETLQGLSEEFHLCHTHGTFYYQRRDVSTDARPSKSGWVPAASASTFDLVEGSATWVGAIQAAAERIQTLAARQAPAIAAAAAARPRADLRLALDLLAQERFSEALDLLHAIPPEAGHDPDVLLLHALLLAHGGQFAAAEQTCHQLLAGNELNSGAHYVLALCREGAGDARAAADHDQMAAYLDPLFAMPRLHLGLVARRGGDRETARREFNQAMLLLQREDASRLLFFGGGFSRDTLIALCRAELHACGDRP